MANLDEDIYQRQGTEHDAPDNMVPNKPGWWWYKPIIGNYRPVRVYRGPDGYLRLDEGDCPYLDKVIGYWRKIGGKPANDVNILCRQLKSANQEIARLCKQLESGQHPAHDAMGPTITPDPDTKRRDDHANFYADHMRLISEAVLLMTEDQGKPAIDAWTRLVKTVYLDVWDHATKHAMEDAAAKRPNPSQAGPSQTIYGQRIPTQR